MTSISASSQEPSVLDLVRSAKVHLLMFTPQGTFPEACAFLVGLDRATAYPFLEGFQRWLSDRHSGRPELAFWHLVLTEIGLPSDRRLTADEDAQATTELFELVETYLANGGTPAAVVELGTPTESELATSVEDLDADEFIDGGGEAVDPNDLYPMVLGILDSVGARPLSTVLLEGHQLRGGRLFALYTQLPPVIAGFNELLAHSFEIEARVAELSDIAAVGFLIERFRFDVEVSIEALLGGRHAILADCMRDVMEMEMLVRDFSNDLRRVSKWLTSDDNVRRNDFGPGRVRRRVASAMYPGQSVELPDTLEYQVHSIGLHATPYNPPDGTKGLATGTETSDLLLRAGEVFEHARRFFEASYALMSAAGEPTTSNVIGRDLPAAADAWSWWMQRMEEIKAQFPPGSYPERVAQAQPAKSAKGRRRKR